MFNWLASKLYNKIHSMLCEKSYIFKYIQDDLRFKKQEDVKKNNEEFLITLPDYRNNTVSMRSIKIKDISEIRDDGKFTMVILKGYDFQNYSSTLEKVIYTKENIRTLTKDINDLILGKNK